VARGKQATFSLDSRLFCCETRLKLGVSTLETKKVEDIFIMYRLGMIRSRPLWQRSLASGLVASGTVVHERFIASPCRYTSSEPQKNNNDGNKNNEKKVFDLTQEWEQATAQGKEYFTKWIVTDDTKEDDDKTGAEEESFLKKANIKLPDFVEDFLSPNKDTNEDIAAAADEQQKVSFASMMKNVSKILLGTGDDESNKNAMQDLVEQARKSSSGKGDVKDSTSFTEIMKIMDQHRVHLDQTLEDTFGHIDLSKIFPTSMYYYIERDDEVKNPSWKRRMHRFHPGVDIEQVNDLASALYLAELSYADSLEEIQEGLLNTKSPVELVYCDTESTPNEPAHFIVLKKEQSLWSNELEVVIVVRGTRSVSDALTDAFMEATDYRGGKAHKGILESGRFLVGQHVELLEKLCKLANKKTVKLTLVGHSLGAGAAAIAGIEFNDHPMINAKVIGFGCPSLLSQELAKSTQPFITTVVADADMIPRMNGATIGNKLLDIMEYDWIPRARRDIVHALEEVQRVAPALLNESSVEYIMDTVDSWLETYVKPTIPSPTTNRAENILYPPGTCIHFYRDGAGITGSETPCTFFNELDVSRTMIDDHLIDQGYRRIFLEVMRQYKRDHHFSFEEDKYWK